MLNDTTCIVVLKYIYMNDFLKWIGRALLGPLGGIAGSGAFLLNRLDGGNRSNYLDDIWKGASELLGLKKPLQEQINSYTNTLTQSGPTGRDEWLANREDTVYQRSVRDMKAAGLNPALMYNGGASQVPVSSASSGNAAGLSDILQLALLPLEMKRIEAETKDINAGAEQKRSQTRGQEIDNAWKDIINQTAVDAKRASTELSRSRVREIDQMINESETRIVKLIEETKEVDVRTELEISQMLLNQANANRVAELLEYEKLEFEARTSAERAAASHSMANAAYQNGLITNGMIESICKKEGAEAVAAEVQAAIADPDYRSENDSKVDQVCRTIVAGINRTVRMFRGK